MISFDLKGKTALVTGAASGLGLGTARMLAESGATVALNFLPDDPRGPQAVEQLSSVGNVIAAPGNVGDAASAEAMVANAVSALGRLDLLVNNAATPGVKQPIPVKRLDLITEELWATVLDVNLLGVFRCSKAAAPALKASNGAIVNVASTASFNARGSTIPYAAAKTGVVVLTKNFARALAPEVRVNAIAPGFIDSNWIEWPEEIRRTSAESTLLKRVAKPSELAEVILYLGFGANIITGFTVLADNGLLLN